MYFLVFFHLKIRKAVTTWEQSALQANRLEPLNIIHSGDRLFAIMGTTIPLVFIPLSVSPGDWSWPRDLLWPIEH